MNTDVLYTPKSAWHVYRSPEHEKKMHHVVETYRAFLQTCKTERETIRYAVQRLRSEGFSEDPKSDLVFFPFREKALFALRRGTLPLREGLSLIAAHVDSPRLDLKQKPFVEEQDVLLGKTHYYGGIRKYQWLSRPLALHGVIVREDGHRIDVSLGEKEDEPVFTIADLLPHLAQKQEEQIIKDAFDGEKLSILAGHALPPEAEDTGAEDRGAENTETKKAAKDCLKKAVFAVLQQTLGCPVREEDCITAELELVPAGPARYVGFDKALLGGYGQDDRICAFTALDAFLAAEHLGQTKALLLWDKEEIGSDGATGASSRFFQYCITDFLAAHEPSTPVHKVLLATNALSADVTAAIEPHYAELHDSANAARLGYGPCFSKFTGSRGKYGASEADAEYFARVRGHLNKHGIPWQVAELGKVDSGGGGTVALFLAAWGMRVIDLGPALLAMHSPFEIASCVDIYATRMAYEAFYNAIV